LGCDIRSEKAIIEQNMAADEMSSKLIYERLVEPRDIWTRSMDWLVYPLGILGVALFRLATAPSINTWLHWFVGISFFLVLIYFLLKRNPTEHDIWPKWLKSLIRSSGWFLGLSALILFESPSWLSWVTIVCVIFVEIFVYRNVLTTVYKTIVTIDLHDGRAISVKKLVIGTERMKELSIDQVFRILIRVDDIIKTVALLLDVQSGQPLEIATYSVSEPWDNKNYVYNPALDEFTEVKSLGVLAIKISKLLGKPVIQKTMEYNDVVSEEDLTNVLENDET
jgi:hypothetical protein